MSTLNISDRDYNFRLGHYLSRGWEIFKANALPFVGFTLLTGIIFAALSFILPYPLGSGDPEAQQYGGNLIGNILSPLFTAGFYIVALQIARGRPTAFSDFFRGFNRALPVILLAIVSGILLFLGFMLLILPGLYLAVAYMFSLPLLLDKSLDFWPALENSRKIITKKWFSFFLFAIVLFFLNVAGILLLGIGLLVTAPWTVCAITAAYEDIVGLNSVADAE